MLVPSHFADQRCHRPRPRLRRTGLPSWSTSRREVRGGLTWRTAWRDRRARAGGGVEVVTLDQRHLHPEPPPESLAVKVSRVFCAPRILFGLLSCLRGDLLQHARVRVGKGHGAGAPVGGRETVCRRLIKGGTRVAPASPSTSTRPEHPIVQCLESGEDWRWCYVG